MTLIGQILKGKTLARILFNRHVATEGRTLSGRVLDLASGEGSYHSLLPQGIELIDTDRPGSASKIKAVDFNSPLPFPDDSFNHVLLFNSIYICEQPVTLLRELYRIVAPGGSVLLASPFLQNEMREPHDYFRLTSESLERISREAGFSAAISPYGERFSVAANLLHSFLLTSIIRLFVYPLALMLDRCIPASVQKNHPAPLGYFCVFSK